MTDLLERAVAAARDLPPDLQDEIARLMLSLAGEAQTPVELSEEDERALLASREQAGRGEFASDDEVRAVWSKYGL